MARNYTKGYVVKDHGKWRAIVNWQGDDGKQHRMTKSTGIKCSPGQKDNRNKSHAEAFLCEWRDGLVKEEAAKEEKEKATASETPLEKHCEGYLELHHVKATTMSGYMAAYRKNRCPCAQPLASLAAMLTDNVAARASLQPRPRACSALAPNARLVRCHRRHGLGWETQPPCRCMAREGAPATPWKVRLLHALAIDRFGSARLACEGCGDSPARHRSTVLFGISLPAFGRAATAGSRGTSRMREGETAGGGVCRICRRVHSTRLCTR